MTARKAVETEALASRGARFWSWLTAPLDDVLADAARDGELFVARVRTWITLLVLVIPLVALAMAPDRPEHYIGLVIAATAVGIALLLDRLVRRGIYRSGIAAVITVVDASLISAALLIYWLIGDPLITVNSRVVFEGYFLVIAASSLRYAPRMVVLSGAVVMIQYLGLSLLVWHFSPAESLTRGVTGYGEFDWSTQIARLVMLFAMTIVALAVVDRTTRLRRLSTFDRLTGLFNRSYIEEFLGHEIVRSMRERRPMVLAMLDVDHFKQFNDTHGHAAGDRALRKVADTLRAALRRSDVVARFGGEELLLAMPGTTVEAAIDKLEQVRVRIGLTEIPLPKGGSAKVTVSIGVASTEIDGNRIDQLLDAADGRMYGAKQAGRNRVFGPENDEMSLLNES